MDVSFYSVVQKRHWLIIPSFFSIKSAIKSSQLGEQPFIYSEPPSKLSEAKTKPVWYKACRVLVNVLIRTDWSILVQKHGLCKYYKHTVSRNVWTAWVLSTYSCSFWQLCEWFHLTNIKLFSRVFEENSQ